MDKLDMKYLFLFVDKCNLFLQKKDQIFNLLIKYKINYNLIIINNFFQIL